MKKSCYGTKEISLKSIICKNCELFRYCKLIKNKSSKLQPMKGGTEK